ncbi:MULTISPECIES: hypothetical protein [Bacillus]|uniref:hypothetical protein n=1 Tax=Bacillus TaxID=1386 RepID=UPI0012B69519|nr:MULTISPECIES: hypothetical protein [Bacillus]
MNHVVVYEEDICFEVKKYVRAVKKNVSLGLNVNERRWWSCSIQKSIIFKHAAASVC